MLILLLSTCQLGAMEPFEVVRKPLHPTTDLVRHGELCVQVVVPDGPDYQPLGALVAEAVGKVCGHPVPVVRGEELIDPQTHLLRADLSVPPLAKGGPRGVQSHFILLGAFYNNPLLARLYYTFYDPTDAYFPGPGGYELRTVCAPFEYGYNCLVLGGSDLAGVRRAVEAFVARLEGPDVPYFREVVPGGAAVRRIERWQAQYSEEWLAGLERYLDRRHPDFEMWFSWWDRSSETAWYQGCLAVAGTTMMRYEVSGLPGAGEACRRMVRTILDHADVLDRLENNYFEYCLPQFLLGWDRVEESGLFTAEECQAVVQLLAKIGQLSDESFWNFRDPGKPPEEYGFQGRHQLDGTKALHDLAVYLQRNCEISAEFRRMTEGWQRGARALFAKHAAAPLVADAYFGFYEAQLVAEWAFASGDHTYFHNGGLRTAAQLSTATIDNLLGGYAFGWGGQGVATMAAPPLVGLMAEWVYDEPSTARSLPAWQETDGDLAGDRWTFWNDGDLGVFGFHFPWRHPPADVRGIAVIPLSAAIYQDVRNGRMALGQGMADTSAPLDRCFQKLALRGGTEPTSEYLLLDGQGGVVYSMADTNAILKLTDRGQRLLVAHHGQPGALGQNVITVSTGLPPEPMEYAARLEHAVELETFGAVASRAARWNGLDWTRHILWLKGRGFVVIDELLNPPAEENEAQRGRRRRPTSRPSPATRPPSPDGGRDVFLTATWNTVANPAVKDCVAEIPLAAGVFRIASAQPVNVRADGNTVRQSQTARLAQGEKVTFCSLLYASTPESPQGYEVRTPPRPPLRRGGLRGGTALRRGGLRGGTALLIKGRWGERERLELVGVGGVTVTSLEGSLEVEADAFSLSADRIALVGGRALRVGGQEVPLEVENGEIKASSLHLDRLLTAAWNAASPPQPPPPAALSGRRLETVWAWSPDALSPAGPLRAGDLDGDGAEEIVVRLDPQRIVALSADGQLLWEYEQEEGMVDLFVIDLEGRGAADVLVAENPRRVVRLRGDGTVAWVWDGVPNNVNLVYADDLTGDGRPEVIVGYFNGYLALTAAGEPLWLKSGYGHNATLCRVRDVDGDGVPELLGGSTAATFCLFDESQAQGAPKYVFEGVQIVGMEFADADGDGREEVFLATDQGLACYSPAQDRYLWSRRSDAPLVGLAVVQRGDGPQLLTATRGAFAQLFSLQGELLANRLVGEAVNALVPCGEGCFALAGDDGRVRLVDAELRPLAWAETQGRPTHLLSVGDRLVVASDTGGVQALRLKQ